MTTVELEQKIARLESEIGWFRRVFRALGFPCGEWLTPSQASPLLNISADTLKNRIDDAELRTQLKQPIDLKYGVHYRKSPGTANVRGGWEINVRAWEELANTPEHLRLSR